MTLTLVTSTQQLITVENKHFAYGGEGKIHKIISPDIYLNCCVKLYESKYRNQTRQAKIEFLIKSAPTHLKNDDFMVCFPQELVFIDQQFAGFIMQLAFEDSIQLESLCTPSIRAVYTLHQNFDRKSFDAFQKRLQLCLNLAVPIHLVHSLNRYVFVDIKPQNILVDPHSKISIIDIDSIQISKNKQVLHSAHVNTPDYIPPEWQGVVIKDKYIPVEWDRFAVAIIFYRILFGIHPYAASFNPPYAHLTTIPDLIKNGFFVQGRNKSAITILPAPHALFNQLDSKLQCLFLAAFEDSLHKPSKRPTLDQWGKTLFNTIKPAGVWKQFFNALEQIINKHIMGSFKYITSVAHDFYQFIIRCKETTKHNTGNIVVSLYLILITFGLSKYHNELLYMTSENKAFINSRIAANVRRSPDNQSDLNILYKLKCADEVHTINGINKEKGAWTEITPSTQVPKGTKHAFIKSYILSATKPASCDK